eukprot:4010805-Pleurochrysis_carterae.AAC.1
MTIETLPFEELKLRRSSKKWLEGKPLVAGGLQPNCDAEWATTCTLNTPYSRAHMQACVDCAGVTFAD